MPEVRVLGMLIEVIGVDMFLAIIGGHIIFLARWAYIKSLQPILHFCNYFFEKIDPYYFVAKGKDVAECPQLILHAVPCFIGILFFSVLQC